MKQRQLKHLYVHIPFCASICTYCDFERYVCTNSVKSKYIKTLIKELFTNCHGCKFDTIYVGGGTPNCLNDKQLAKLLNALHACASDKCEFSIECNPEFLTLSQAKLLQRFGVNRVSIGAQTTNSMVLKRFNRQHGFIDVKKAVEHLRQCQITNISLDFVYGYEEISLTDINGAINFIHEYAIPHVSFYALELKPHALLTKTITKLDDTLSERDLRHIIKRLADMGYQRYEVSNWCLQKRFQCQHNLAYWLTKDWCGIGLGACGYTYPNYYVNTGNVSKWSREFKHYTLSDHYFQTLMMGLRLTKGLDLRKQSFLHAYNHFKKQLHDVRIKNHHLVANNINLLDNILVDII
ncbi:MAG: radical SAM family heme chaperone HemW [Mycoplasmataceae bacterium]|jgi:oxygen-independent coproporphyrinogen-3 oxidase|nr:radical SAM family heme chaperone HemW [Mycoplasmataceae bacterium]